MTDKPTAVFDLEVYKDFFLAAFRSVDTGRVKYFEMYDGHPFDREGVKKILRNNRLVSFNGNNFDVPLILLALKETTTPIMLKKAADDIIVRGLKPWQLRDKYAIPEVEWIDHVDLIEVAPGIASLKAYGGRMNSRRMQDLPIEPDASIAKEQRQELISYCCNDLSTTIDLLKQLTPQIELRGKMSDEYGIDLRSKSDAQIAEAVIRKQIEQIKGDRLYRPEFPRDYNFKYEVPEFITFKTKELRDVLTMVRDATFTLGDSGSVEMPQVLESARIRIGDSVYRMGIGGLHSSEESKAHIADGDYLIVDVDATAFYPSIIMLLGLYPENLGQDFLTVYRRIVERRVAAKRSGDKVTDAALKITINGSFGKFGSKWSTLYSPNLLIQVTVTGQLSLLMLIESLELAGIPVVSANTDGIVIKCPRTREKGMRAIIKAFEFDTGFNMEFTHYKALYSQSVNTYIALKEDGGVKLKGTLAPPGLQKNPQNAICVEAVVNYLKDGTPLEDTIEWCTDIRKFITIRQVKGGALWRGQYLGRVVRWYYAKGCEDGIHYKTNGNLVAKSTGAKPLMELPDNIPSDLDYRWYYNEARSIIDDIGAKYEL